MATYELEPCPCCGGPGMLKDTHGKIRQGWVGCRPCGLYIGWKISPDGAIRKWNKRAVNYPEALTPQAVSLIKLLPELVNDLAARIGKKLDEANKYWDYPDVKADGPTRASAPTKEAGGASPATTEEAGRCPHDSLCAHYQPGMEWCGLFGRNVRNITACHRAAENGTEAGG